jgi:two-component system chemotaxis response regulator CheY
VKKKYTVLLADDDKVQTLMLSTLLRTKGYMVAAAYDATYAFMVAMKSPLDAIVLDIQMPGGTGMGVLERLRASSKTMQIPVIVLSSSTDDKTVAAVKALGADEFLPKPVDPEQLLAALARVLGSSGEPDTVPRPIG